jgi:hypothetical protein
MTLMKSLRRPCRLRCEELEARQLLSGGPWTPPGDLRDPLMARIAQTEFVQDNGQLSRSDVIHLLRVVDGIETAVFAKGRVHFVPATPNPQASLTASQLTDLQTLAQDAALWGLTADVSNLLGKVVNQNVANEQYQGSPLLPSGQITAGTPDAVLQDLVGKWFYGTDLPAVAAAVANNNIPDTVVYQTAQGRLFGPHGPKAVDIAQGWVGDCYFLSSLGEVAQQSPQTIQSMLLNNHDGTYTVRFYQLDAADGTWHADYVTVNLQLPVLQQSGQYAFADWYQGGQQTTVADPHTILWPALVEKAYAQLAEEGWSRATGPGGSGNNSTPSDWSTNSYDALAYGDGVALQQITGSSITYVESHKNALATAFQHGSLVIFGSLGQEPANMPTDSTGAPLIVSGHVYFLKAANASRDQFTLINPYDDSSSYPTDGQRTVTLSWGQLQQYLYNAFVVAPPPIDPTHAVVQQGANTGINGHAPAVNIQWFDNGVAISDPSQIQEGDTVTVTFDTLPGAKKTEFSLVTYAAPNGVFNGWNVDHQQEWADTTATFKGAGHHSLTVTVPDGYFQLDFVQGDAIADFATGARYHSEGRFLDGTQGGDHVVS